MYRFIGAENEDYYCNIIKDSILYKINIEYVLNKYKTIQDGELISDVCKAILCK